MKESKQEFIQNGVTMIQWNCACGYRVRVSKAAINCCRFDLIGFLKESYEQRGCPLVINVLKNIKW
jgi:hypothetical protein